MTGGISPPDPYIIVDPVISGQAQYRVTPSQRSITINPVQKTLVLFVAGQSNWTNITPTLYTPTNSSAVSQLNVYDGAFYPVSGAVLGSSFYQGSFGVGNISVRVADTLVSNGIFNQVLIVNIAIGSTSAAQWATSQFTNRIAVAMLRLSQNGITPATTGVTFGFIWGQGEAEVSLGTSQSAYTASLNTVLSAATTAGFSGRFFICEETWISGSVSTAVQAAQTGIVNGTTIFSGGNLDSLNATNRQGDNTHFNDTGAAAAATLVYNAMHASGSPY
jgi:hypothetical protein